MPGPLPKRAEDRVRRNKTGEDGLEIEYYNSAEPVIIPFKAFQNETIEGLWNAIKMSVNVQYYEPSDWWYAILVLEQWDAILSAGKNPGAMHLSALDSMLSRMLITEADRRRLKIEAKRQTPEEDRKAKSSDFYKDQFNKQVGHLGLVPDWQEACAEDPQ